MKEKTKQEEQDTNIDNMTNWDILMFLCERVNGKGKSITKNTFIEEMVCDECGGKDIVQHLRVFIGPNDKDVDIEEDYEQWCHECDVADIGLTTKKEYQSRKAVIAENRDKRIDEILGD